MKDKKNIFVYVLLVLFVVLLASLWCFLFNFYDNNRGRGNALRDTNDDKVLSEIIDLSISYNGDFIDLDGYISKFDNNESNKGKLLSIVVNNMMVNGREYVFKLNNHPQNCLDLVNSNSYNDEYNSYYINNKEIYQQNNQACYLERVHLITVIDNKYIGISFMGEAGNYMNIYDEKSSLVDKLDVLSIEVIDGKIMYTDYEKEDDECLINTYTYEIIDDKPVKTLKDKGNEKYCNQMTGEGCCS